MTKSRSDGGPESRLAVDRITTDVEIAKGLSRFPLDQDRCLYAISAAAPDSNYAPRHMAESSESANRCAILRALLQATV